MLSDVLHAILHRYLENMETEQANNLLTNFVEDNKQFIRTDADINVINLANL